MNDNLIQIAYERQMRLAGLRVMWGDATAMILVADAQALSLRTPLTPKQALDRVVAEHQRKIWGGP
jgi:hypothetical protein